MIKILARLRKSSDGATAIEYGLLVGMIGLAAAVALETVGTSLFNFYDLIEQSVDSAGPINP